MKFTVKVYPISVMSEAEFEAPSEAKAIELAEALALRGGLKFYAPDRRFVSLIYKEAKLRTKAPPASRSEGELLEGGQDDGS